VTLSAKSQLKGVALAQLLLYPGPAEALGSTAWHSNFHHRLASSENLGEKPSYLRDFPQDYKILIKTFN